MGRSMSSTLRNLELRNVSPVSISMAVPCLEVSTFCAPLDNIWLRCLNRSASSRIDNKKCTLSWCTLLQCVMMPFSSHPCLAYLCISWADGFIDDKAVSVISISQRHSNCWIYISHYIEQTIDCHHPWARTYIVLEHEPIIHLVREGNFCWYKSP